MATTDDRTDGLVNGSTNGLVNGSTNGLVDGSTDGAVNGATDGSTQQANSPLVNQLVKSRNPYVSSSCSNNDQS